MLHLGKKIENKITGINANQINVMAKPLGFFFTSMLFASLGKAGIKIILWEKQDKVKVEHFVNFYFVLFLISHVEFYFFIFLLYFEDKPGRGRDWTEKEWMCMYFFNRYVGLEHITMSVLGMILYTF